MYWQRRYITKEYSLPSNAATEVIDLPRSNFLSGLLVRLAWTNGTGVNAQDIVDIISKIEVIANGSKVLYSLSGIEAYKIAYILGGKRPHNYRSMVANDIQVATLPILFGRYLGDPEFYLDLSAYTDVKLHITYAPTIGTNGFASGAGVLSVIALMAMEGSPPGARRGFIRTTTVKAFTTADSGDVEVSLPRAHPYYGIGVYCYEAGVGEGVDISYVKLDLNNGEKTPFEGRWVDIQEQNEVDLGIIPIEEGIAALKNNDTLETRVGRVCSFEVASGETITIGTTDTTHFSFSFAGSLATATAYTIEGSATWAANAAQTTPVKLYWRAKGVGVGHFIYIPFAIGGNLDLLLDSARYDAVDLILTQGGAGGTARVILQEVLPS